MTWLDKEKLLEIAQSDGEVTLTSEQVELLFEENAKLVKALEGSNDLLRVQGYNGNWNYDAYMHGMFNGMELIVSMMELREPEYREAPAEWLCDREVTGEPVFTREVPNDPA